MRILYVDIDTLRPDHLGCYGYHRTTSPTIDEIAEQGVCFQRYHCSDAPCLPSRTALMTGRFGIHSGVVGHGGTAADMRLEGAARTFKSRLEVESLPGVLSSNGYTTACISPFAARHGAWSFYAGFSQIHNTGRSGMESADEVMPLALQWLQERATDDNWFLYVNLWDPHTPYRVPETFGNPFSSEPIPTWLTEEVLEQHRAMVGPHKAGNVAGFSDEPDGISALLPEGTLKTPTRIDNMTGLKRMFDGYDIGIRYADEHMRHLLDALRAKGVWDETAIIVSSDHGESMGELGIYGEHGTADAATTRLPMIVRWPGHDGGFVADGLHYNLDLAPTVAELLGFEAPPIWDGQSYADTIRTGADRGRDYLVLSQCAHVCQRAVRFDNWFYIRTYHDGFHLFPQEMLFDIATDPHEQKDLAAERREVCRDAVYRLTCWHDEMMSSMSSDVDPLWTVIKEGGPYHARGALKSYCELLERTGRAPLAAQLKAKHPRELGDSPESRRYARQAYWDNLLAGFEKRKKPGHV